MSRTLTRQEASDAVSELGWRYILGTLRTSVPVQTLLQASELAAAVVTACGADADQHLRLDLRPDLFVLTLQSLDQARVTERDVELARLITAAIGQGEAAPSSVQLLEIAIDAMDIPAIRPFWQALLGYADEPCAGGPEDALVDPAGFGPAFWFQQMSEPRTERNRIHFDLCVPHDEAASRIKSALDAGGRLLSDAEAPAFWVLADPEGNEACITTWQGRD